MEICATMKDPTQCESDSTHTTWESLKQYRREGTVNEPNTVQLSFKDIGSSRLDTMAPRLEIQDHVLGVTVQELIYLIQNCQQAPLTTQDLEHVSALTQRLMQSCELLGKTCRDLQFILRELLAEDVKS